MPISERSLHPYIKGLIEEYGKLTVTDLNALLRQVLILDAADLTPLKGRKDDKFSQITRNLVSHSKKKISSINGYIIDKRDKPAIFYAISSDKYQEKDNEKRIISNEEIKIRQEKRVLFNSRKIDYISLNRERTQLGYLGEQFALEWERDRLRKLDVKFDVNDEVIHFSQRYGDGAGYDILSRYDSNYVPLYIEVKTTRKGLNEPFFMSVNEKLFMELYDNVLIYRVFNFDKDLNIGEIEIINKKDLDDKYIFNPITFKVSLKNV